MPARLASGLLLLALVAGCQSQGVDDSSAATDHAAMGHGADATGSSYTDLRFLDGMTAHHRMALDMSGFALTDAAGASPDVRRLASSLIAAQRAEVDTMAAWRARWFADAPAPAPHSADDMAAMGMAGMDINALGTARGADFDRLFLSQMIPHHAGALTMADEARVRTGRPEIRALAAQILASQAREIGQMQAWLDAADA